MTPKIIRTIAELREEIAARKSAMTGNPTVGFVPTMGYLHDGHASLLRQSSSDNGLTVLSIFVNPTQFGPGEDLDKYPRDEQRDLNVAARSGADLVFIPSVEEMYPRRRATSVTVSDVTERLCGASRPGHFDGVALVVTKLFNIVQPDRAYFGMKDAQQIAVIATMVRDLNIPVEIVPCPIVREQDGLALSSRNVYLAPEERKQALVLSQSLSRVTEWIRGGMTPQQTIQRLQEEIRRAPLADIDYVDVLKYPDLVPAEADRPLSEADGRLLIAVAVRFGKTRLIDNRLINPAEVGADICFAK
ncbi:pantoate--beta-alanine ligase [Cohnella cholangitidis]|uniref:Pantothenate synthetase n=1 Tax=Cohnella cholangitidis TaxID=2598458 RepID=A0A7G5C5C9_9BACL|nr:pantoate--beta-alanine ligase [Cohnella cholangitidis]QMV44413.1 pantoate--beta-alanine ligase [Cohnella cholangitidis]